MPKCGVLIRHCNCCPAIKSKTGAPFSFAAETLNLERTLSDLVNQAYALTPAEIDLLWKTAPPRMSIPPPTTTL